MPQDMTVADVSIVWKARAGTRDRGRKCNGTFAFQGEGCPLGFRVAGTAEFRKSTRCLAKMNDCAWGYGYEFTQFGTFEERPVDAFYSPAYEFGTVSHIKRSPPLLWSFFDHLTNLFAHLRKHVERVVVKPIGGDILVDALNFH
tara:strand:- start:772 stop:1203 length:432 start_codon:yes stop_codon:yes gene_type:complete